DLNWRKFVLAFDKTPLEVLNSGPEDSLRSMRTQYRKLLSQAGRDETDAKVVTLAWHVVVDLDLRKQGLLGRKGDGSVKDSMKE
ncbi:unnamed protein product, partial [marine sediment metagenome]